MAANLPQLLKLADDNGGTRHPFGVLRQTQYASYSHFCDRTSRPRFRKCLEPDTSWKVMDMITIQQRHQNVDIEQVRHSPIPSRSSLTNCSVMGPTPRAGRPGKSSRSV